MFGLQRANSPCSWIYCFGEQTWETHLLETGLRLNSGANNWPDAVRQCAEGILPYLSGQARRIVGDKWIFSSNWAEDRAWFSAHFNYALVLLAARSPRHISLISETSRKLDEEDPDCSSPASRRARELFEIGLRRLSQGLIEKAVDAFRQSERENELNFLLHLQLGKLYLYGIDEYVNVIDLQEAERQLRAAARFARLHPARNLACNQFAAEAYFHAAVACYAQASTAALAKNREAFGIFLETGLGHLARAIDLNPALAETHYHRAKFRARLGQTGAALEALREAILADPNYCLKADIDPDFALILDHVFPLFEDLRQETEKEFSIVAGAINQFKNRNGQMILSARVLETMEELNQAEVLLKEIERKPYLYLLEDFHKIRSLHSSLQALTRNGFIGDPLVAASQAQWRLEEAAAAVELAQQLGLSQQTGGIKLQELRLSLGNGRPYYADIIAEARELRDSSFNVVQDYFRHLQANTTGRLEKLRDELVFAQLAERDCRGVFGGVGVLATLAGAGLGGMIGFFLGHFLAFCCVAVAIALCWFTWSEGFIGRLRWRRVARHTAAEVKALEKELDIYGQMLAKCAAGTLTAKDLPE